MSYDVTLDVGRGLPIDPSRSISTSSSEDSFTDSPLPSTLTRSSSSEIELNSERMSGAPAQSLYKSVGEGVTRQLTGFSPKEIKDGFQKAWQKDKKLGRILGGLKMAGRCLGFATGTLINLTGRIAALGVAAAAATTAGVLQFVFTPVKSFKNPHAVMNNIMNIGITSGVIAGSGISFIGMKLSQCTSGIKLTNQGNGSKTTTFDRVVEDNSIPGLVGMAVGAGIACLYPAMWQLPFRGSKDADTPSIDQLMRRAEEIRAERNAITESDGSNIDS